MDYTRQSTAFKVKKALRYVRLYGVRRTLTKVQSQYHMRRRYDSLPEPRNGTDPRRHVGMIGCGNFGFSTLAYFLNKNYGRVIRAAMDVDPNRSASLYEQYGLDYHTDDAEKLIADPAIDMIYVATNHASHADYAIRALETGKSVHIEKPHAVTMDQLQQLCGTMSRSEGAVSLGFNRPLSPLACKLREELNRQEGPAIFNWFVAGHVLPADHWYLRDGEGGRVLGNLCHWSDFVYTMAPEEKRYPITIRPTRFTQPDINIVVSYTFGDGTIACISFSEKGEPFEGVREVLTAQRGEALAVLQDFKSLTVDVADDKSTTRGFYRDHGHEARVCASYETSRTAGGHLGALNELRYIWETGELFLRTKEALDRNCVIEVQPFDPSRLTESAAPNRISRA